MQGAGHLRLPVRLALILSIKFGAIIDFCLGGDSPFGEGIS